MSGRNDQTDERKELNQRKRRSVSYRFSVQISEVRLLSQLLVFPFLATKISPAQGKKVCSIWLSFKIFSFFFVYFSQVTTNQISGFQNTVFRLVESQFCVQYCCIYQRRLGLACVSLKSSVNIHVFTFSVAVK